MIKLIKILLLFSIIFFSPESLSNNLLTDKKGELVKKIIEIDDIKHHYYVYNSISGKFNPLYIIFHGGKNGAQDFLRNTGIHNRLKGSDLSFIVFESFGDPNWFKNYSLNKKIINRVLDVVYDGVYSSIHFIGYTEGGTFATDLYCDGIYGANYIWNINGTMKKSCQIKNNTDYILMYGDKMDISSYENIYYKNFDDIKNYLVKKDGDCSVVGETTAYGSRFDNTFVNKLNFKCNSKNSVDIYIMKNVGRNFPSSYSLDLDDFVGETTTSIELYQMLLKKIR